MSTITVTPAPSDIKCPTGTAPIHQPPDACGEEGEGLVPQGHGEWRAGMPDWKHARHWRDESQLMVCCRPKDHAGEHFDAHDEVAWS